MNTVVAPAEYDAERVAWTRWTVFAYLAAGILAAALGYFLFRMPLEVSDDIGNMLSVRSVTFGQLMVSQFTAHGFLRPFLWGTLKIVFDLAHGHYFVTFRAFHAAQVLLTLVLAVRLMRVRTAADWAVSVFALVVLVGIHTFPPMVREAYPINTFLSIIVYCLAAANVSMSRGGWWADVAAVLLFVVATLTVESGLLVWVCVVAGFLVGYRGVSRRGIVAMTLLLAAYFYLRFGPLAVGSPGLVERSSGYGFAVLDPPQLVARFGAHPIWFYAYNVLSSAVSVLFAEPRAGVWEFARAISRGDGLPPWILINVVSSTVTSVLLLIFVARRAGDWLRLRVEPGDRPVLVFLAVLAANAAISYPYTKDEIMSTAGLFYAVAVYWALAGLLRDRRLQELRFAVPLALVLAGVGSLWAVRVVGLGYNMRYGAFTNRNDWATVDEWLASQHVELKTPDERRFIRDLQNQMLDMRIPSPRFMEHEWERYFDQH